MMSWNALLSSNGGGRSKGSLLKLLVTAIITVIGAVTAYHATIYDIKSEIATKADSAVVEEINLRLTRIETLLTETVATKKEQMTLTTEIEHRLSAIEAKLNNTP